VVLGVEYLLGRHSTTESHPQSFLL
jgi:hypothetical protein